MCLTFLRFAVKIENMWDILLDSLLDSLKIFPFLFLIYVLMEVIEAKHDSEKTEKLLTGKFAPVMGGLVGIVPECGFSAVYAKLYDNGLITTGTLLSIFLSASDEGLIVMLANGQIGYAFLLVGIKAVYGIIIGVIFNAVFSKSEKLSYGNITGACMECGEEPEGPWKRYLLHPLLHSVKIFIFVFIVSFAFGVLIFTLGEENITAFLSANAYLQPLASALIGLIPNCSASVILAQGFNVGAINFAGLAAGLAANAGIGLALIFKNKKRIKNNLFILVSLFIASVLLGYLVLLFL